MELSNTHPSVFGGEKKAIVYNGLLANKNVVISKDIELCDYIFCCGLRDFKRAKNYKDEYFKKLIIIDYMDKTDMQFNKPCLKYFKRSVVNKKNMKFIKYNREIIPISHCLKTGALEFKNVHKYDRDIDISVFFSTKPDPYSIIRVEVAKFIKDNFSDYNISVGVIGKKGNEGRNSIQKAYHEKMFHSKIVVTCNPDNWEGDYRTWEALSSGALVFVDNMKTPIINPLIDKKHVIFYNKKNLLELKEKILFYLKNPKLIKKIAKEGNNYALKFHKPSDRIDEILSYL